jgi:signal transduction histidine kinase
MKGLGFVAITSLLLYALMLRRERTLHAVGTELRATIESMLDGVLLVDARGHVVQANRAAAELLGIRSRDELVGPLSRWTERFQLRFLDGSPIPWDRFAATGDGEGATMPPFDAIARRADGRDVFVSVAASPVLGPDGKASVAVAVLRDVSAARRLDELRDEFLSTAAHEFKTPLAVVKAYAQLLQKRDPAEAQALMVIQRQVDRLNRLVQHLLDTTRLRLDGDAPRERFDLGAVAAEVVDAMRPSSPGHSLTVDARRAPVLGDRERIARVVTSLVENAVRFSPRGGGVDVRVEARGEEAVFSVEDHGVGIAPERQARLFERFYRAHAGTAEDYGGLGLGLEMSREIVQRHGGRMWFVSEEGKGSTFHFAMPLAPEGRA